MSLPTMTPVFRSFFVDEKVELKTSVCKVQMRIDEVFVGKRHDIRVNMLVPSTIKDLVNLFRR